MKGYLGSLMRMTGLHFGGESPAGPVGHMSPDAGPQPIHVQETRFSEPPAQAPGNAGTGPVHAVHAFHEAHEAHEAQEYPAVHEFHQVPAVSAAPAFHQAPAGGASAAAENVKAPDTAAADINTEAGNTPARESNARQGNPGEVKPPAVEKKLNEEQSKTPGHFEQVAAIKSFEPLESIPSVEPVEPARESRGNEGVSDASVTLSDVQQWVKETPATAETLTVPGTPDKAKPAEAARTAQPGKPVKITGSVETPKTLETVEASMSGIHQPVSSTFPREPQQEVQEFSLSIGSIHLTVEGEQPGVQAAFPSFAPVSGGQPGAAGSGSPASRLGRHYIRVR